MTFLGGKIRTDYSDGDLDKEAGFFILNRTKCPAALVECGFMDNRTELEFLRSPEGRWAMVVVVVVVVGIVESLSKIVISSL
ncbi:MAG: N-acetylmuramoyl-L-alanine amidase [Paludibacteraceae bacterium]|nr:N-acetylmuramoyl-L-alanine amidase [Paludibacteraceae bacterium]